MTTLKTPQEIAEEWTEDYELSERVAIKLTVMKDRQASADVLCALLEGEKRQPTMHQIPCPDNMPGCCVYHCEERLSQIDTIHNQALTLAQDIIRATLSNKEA